MGFRDTINVLCTSGSYTLISYMKGGSPEWNVARDYNPNDKTWSAGNYCYSLESALALFLKKLDSSFVKSDYQLEVEKECPELSYTRIVELGTQFKDGLLEDDPESAAEFFDNVCEMNATEKTFFGLENAEMAFSIADRYISIQKVDGGYDYSIIGLDYKEIGGGVYDNPDVSIRGALNDIVEDLKEPSTYTGIKGSIQPVDKLVEINYEELMEKVESANAVIQTQNEFFTRRKGR